ncbi:MAG: recombinase family protein [Lachnospiraceae bacterium]|nr:recombinase family protein [Lachnospiraceae bacterium]
MVQDQEDKKSIFLYARCSTPKQRIGRQITELKRACPEGIIVKEVYSGATMDRPKWSSIMKMARKGLVREIWMDALDRMGRDREDGMKQYFELMDLGVDLYFLKTPHVNTKTYKENIKKVINIEVECGDPATDELVQSIIKCLNKYILELAKRQIYIAFDEAAYEREVLSQRTSEGLKIAKLNGKRIGRQSGDKIVTKKSEYAKENILGLYQKYGGPLTATQCIRVCQISKASFYTYLKQIDEEEPACQS